MIEQIEAKTILSKLRGEDWLFGTTYSMNLYRGCQHGCIYCDTRSECYRVGDISRISVKKNAIELLTKELRSKRGAKGTIGTGSMNDPYMPIEKELGMTRKALGVIADAKYPVHSITKSNLVTRDADLFQEIGRVYSAVSITITTADDLLAKKLEPNASSTTERFAALSELRKKNVYAGITFMPLLPFVNDTQENVRAIVRRAADVGASYISFLPGVTLRAGSREYLYNCFDEGFGGLKTRYQAVFGDSYICNSPHHKKLNEIFCEETYKCGIATKMKFYKPETNEQLALF